MLRPRSAVLGLLLLAGLACGAGCSSDAGTSAAPADPPAVDADAVRRVCEPYLAEFDRCLRTTAPGDLAGQRVATVRASFEARLEDPVGRAAVLDTCTKGLAQLRDACR